MKRILFTPVAGPYGAMGVGFDLAQDRLTKHQDIFTQTSHMHCEALHFLAQNLETPSTVLEFPTLDELLAEIEDLKAAGIPMLRIETDYSQNDVGQLNPRVQAFLEVL